MKSEIFIEDYRLDISADISSLLTYEIDNIRNFADRSTTWSKTIVLPGTANNNKLFGHIFQIGAANTYNSTLANVGYNFNASKSADCIIFQDNIQTLKGVLRLLQINIIKGRTEYEVAVFGKLAQLNVALSAGKLEDLDFSAYDALYNAAAVTGSWDNAPGSGVYYPLIDYGTYSVAKHDWDIRTFRPALYVREYIDKMFTAAGFRWSSALMDTDRFKRLVVPHNQKELQGLSSGLLHNSQETDITLLTSAGISNAMLAWENVDTSIFTASMGNTRFTYTGSPITMNFNFNVTGYRRSLVTDFTLKLLRNGIEVPLSSLHIVSNNGTFLVPYLWFKDMSVALSTGDYIEFFFQADQSGSDTNYLLTVTHAEWTVTSSNPVVVPITPGDNTQLNFGIPKNIRQLDFLVSIVKLWNLYVYEDKFDTSLIYLKPYVDFYSTNNSNARDWTYKLNRDKAIKIKPMSELNARKYEFKYKPDSDYYNDLYRKRYNEGYGDYVFDSLYEFATQTQAFELIFSSTPLVGYNGEEKVYATIFKRTGDDAAPVEERTDSNIRILQTKKIIGVASWDIKDDVTVLTSTTNYGYAGHFDDPDAPSNDINFGALRELFFELLTGDLSVTQFNVYWSAYMAEITDKDSKLMSAWFYLTPMDISQLDFSKYVWVDGVLFRLNKIGDYNTTKPSDTLVELFKVGYTNYTESGIVIPEDFLLWDDGQILLWSDTEQKLKYA